MAAWTPGLSALIAIGKGIKGTTHVGISDNITALAEGASGAPKIQTAAYDTGSVDQAAIGAAAVGQGELKTTTGTVSTTGGSFDTTLPGGEYGFYPRIKSANAGGNAYWGAGGSPVSANWAAKASGTSYAARVNIGVDTGAGGTATMIQRYISASPPYDLGDGEIPLFVFAVIGGAGEIESIYTAPDPPWAYNGPTDIAATHRAPDGTLMQRRLRMPPTPFDQMTPAQAEAWLAQVVDDRFEVVPVDQALKQADMPDIPHPFMGNDLTGKSIVLIDPVSDLCANLAERHARGQDINALLHEGQLVIDNVEVARATPPGVLAHPVKWKNTP